jgi:diguanylate cyclase (GGDEF)-like protein
MASKEAPEAGSMTGDVSPATAGAAERSPLGTDGVVADQAKGPEEQGTLDPPLGAYLRQLAAVPLFSHMSLAELEPLARACQEVSFQAGEAIVRQGAAGDNVFVVLDGRVEVLARTEGEGVVTESVVYWLMPGDTFGELSLLDGQPRSATCIAMIPTMCLHLEREAFLRAAQRNWTLTLALLRSMATRLRFADKRLAEHASDPLTGVNNRRALLDLYAREVARTQRATRQASTTDTEPLAALFVDINQFKRINDQFGHRVGDEVLCALAQVLVKSSRTTDFVARYGGDEFVIVLPNAGDAGIETVASRIRQVLATEPPGPVPFTISIGSALVDPDQPETFEELLVRADRAMYREKARSRNR